MPGPPPAVPRGASPSCCPACAASSPTPTSPIPVRRFGRAELLPEQQAFLEACLDAGYAECGDHNAPDSTGVGPLPFNHSADGVRWSAAMGYLDPARGRRNLSIRPCCHVERLLLERGRAAGVTVRDPEGTEAVYGAEVLLCCGAIGTPHLLLRSGIGPADHLREVGVPVVHDLPGVGGNLRDHPQAAVVVRAAAGFVQSGTEPRLQIGLRYTAAGSSLRNDMIMLPIGFATAEGHYRRAGSVPIGFTVVPALYLAAGAGSVRLRSPRADVPPLPDYHYLAEASDRERMRESIRIAVDLLWHRSFRPLVVERVSPTDAELRADHALDEWLLRVVQTSHHVSSTCRMGSPADPDSVVDQEGRVHGIDGLRIADASIMPDCVRANTNYTSMAIGRAHRRAHAPLRVRAGST